MAIPAERGEGIGRGCGRPIRGASVVSKRRAEAYDAAVDNSIRPYEPSDYDACRALWHDLTQHHRDIYGDPTIGGDDPGSGFDTYREDPKLDAVWVAVDDDRVVGLTGLLLDGTEGEVEPVVIAPSHRSRGLGRRLLEHVIAEARARDLRSLSIRPVARNALALRRFHEAGFRLLGHVELFLPLDDKERSWKDGIDLHGRTFGY